MFKKLSKSIREYKKTSILTILFTSLEVVMEVFIPFIMAYLIDYGINKGDSKVISICSIILFIVAMLSLTFGILSGKFGAKASCGFAKNLRHDMYYKVQDYSFANIDKFSASSIVTRLTTDVSNVQNAYQMIIRIAVRAPLTLLFSLFMAFFISAKMALIYVCIIPILGGALFFISRKAHPMFERVFKTYDELNNNVQENVRGIRVVKSFVREDYEKEKFSKVSKMIYDYFCKAEKMVALNSPIMQFCMYCCVLLIAWFGSHMIVSSTLTTGELTSFISYTGSILSSLMMLSMIYVMCTMAITSGERIAEILDEESDIRNNEKALTEVKDGSIQFKNVSFSYVNDMHKLSLKNVNLDIQSGEIVGIIGATGSSKSTLVNLISRLYDVTEGEVLVGGANVKDYDLKTLRDNVAVVLQNNVLFSGSIADNLRWGKKDATLEEMERVCTLAQAKEFIDAFPQKYDTHIEQGGTNVSGGQKQRLCIARALLKSPKILILDDSTSAVDTATDAKIRDGFKKYIPEVTKIIIAQRISSIENANHILILENGEVVAYDTPAHLLKTNKIYQEIYNAQKKGGKE